MTIEVFQGDILAKTTDLLVFGVFQGTKRLSGAALLADKAMNGALDALIASGSFEGREGERVTFTPMGTLKARRIVFVGLGSKQGFSEDAYRRFGGMLVRIGREAKATSCTVSFPTHADVDVREAGQAIGEGVELGSYRFHTFKGTQHKKEKVVRELKRVTFIDAEAKTVKLLAEGIERGRAFAEATMFARDLVNTPSSDMTPLQMAEAARSVATRGSGVSCKMLDQKTMERLGMRAALAVARGSMHPPVGVHLIYRPAKTKKRIAIVGKAVTFDSGGLSIKPADGMMTMKIDMAGAAAVIGLFKLLPMLKPNVEVHGIFLAVENMPSGTAYRPGDVVTAMDGTTIEVLNTDAEGRVTLADALSYAVKQEPDMIVDLATLTGACVVALGEEVAAVLGTNEPLIQKLLTASKDAGEPLWELPLHGPYAQHIKSKIADIKNIGGGHGGGVITAAHFLRTFVGDTPWAHLDVAGPTYTERETRPDQPYGASGYGVRLLARFLAKL
ncbi:MAG: leucyl aminopeptidase [Patescibacteria group bacterium]|jgi:leucyl aminopeptidase